MVEVNSAGEEKTIHPEKVSTMILLKFKMAAEVYLSTKITDSGANTLFDTKRLIGRKVADPIVQAVCKPLPFKVISGPGVKPMIEVNSPGEENQIHL